MANLLFSEPVYPSGFSYSPGFISREEESDLLQAISKVELHTFIFQGFEAKRKVASFGYDYSFDNRSLQEGKAIPKAFLPLVEKVAEHTNTSPKDFAELLVIEYPPGAVINWHRDAPPFDIIVGISLAADCTFRLRPHEKAKQNRRSIIDVPVARRSIYVLAGEVRTDWQHSTKPLSETRYSITLRTLRKT
ncbi:MAG: alpha-ketoglutarate-dependent dioxygenase AlkB [Flavisolibacter sp.]